MATARINGSSCRRSGRDGGGSDRDSGRSGGMAQRSRCQRQVSATAGSCGQIRRNNQLPYGAQQRHAATAAAEAEASETVEGAIVTATGAAQHRIQHPQLSASVKSCGRSRCNNQPLMRHGDDVEQWQWRQKKRQRRCRDQK